MPRPAIRNNREYVEDLLAKATHLEAQLAAAPHNNPVRLPLCEALSDILLTDPAFAVQHDVTERLWRHCFYSRIGPMRKKKGKKYEEALLNFLAEAVTLYDYLSNQLQEKLINPEDRTVSDSTVETTVSTEGIVDALHHLQLHMGDLYRYSNNLGKAETAYQRAADLGPGHGHPYNQLAVLCQVKDQQGAAPLAAVAFYWYARSLAASHQVFETSKQNMLRLFTSNRMWLKQQEQTMGDDPSKYHKSVHSRLFLSRFVEFHHVLYVDGAKNEVLLELKAVLNKFEGMLQNSSLGDSLLCKMIVIQAFSESTNGVAFARFASLAMAHELAERFKIQSKVAHPSKFPSSVRLLLPLTLLTEYLMTADYIKVELPELQQKYECLIESFVKSLIVLLNAFGSFDLSGILRDAEPKEYASLRGFKPFSFIKGVTEKGFLCDDDAVAWLQETSASTSTASVGSAPSGESNRVKVARFVRLSNLICDHQVFGSRVRRSHSGTLEWMDLENSPVDGDMVDDEDAGDEVIVMMEDTTEEVNNDTLVYRQDACGGPALLVPGALLQHSSTDPPKNYSSETMDVDQTVQTPTDAPNLYETEKKLQPTIDNGLSFSTLQDSISRGSVLPPPPPGFGLAAQNHSANPSTDPLAALGGSAFVSTNADNLSLFGSLQTNNPFAQSLDSSSLFCGRNDVDDLFSGMMNVDGASLLDSGLLSSIWMDEGSTKQTKNPFAA